MTKGADKAARKAKLRAWRDGERDRDRAAFPLDDARLVAFFAALEDRFERLGCHHDPRHAMHVMDALGLTDAEANALMDWCNDHGGYCDCEIAANTREHWVQARGADPDP